MYTLLLFLSLTTSDGDTTRPVQFDTLAVADAEKLHGRTVPVSLTVWTPVMTTVGGPIRTYFGPADRGDGIERVVILSDVVRAWLLE